MDALQVARYSAGLSLDNFYESAADVKGFDGTVDIVDALEIARYATGLISGSPC